VYAPPLRWAFALAHARLGDTDQALQELELMVDNHVPGSVFLGGDQALLHALRGNSRFEAVLRRVGVPTASAPHTVST
jgi:hypothetical protein